MEESSGLQPVFSKRVRAGKRTYFFDVKETKSGEYYLSITESMKRFDNETGKFTYDKHKLFLYKEDFEKFTNGFSGAIDFVKQNQVVEERINDYDNESES